MTTFTSKAHYLIYKGEGSLPDQKGRGQAYVRIAFLRRESILRFA